MGPLAPGLLTHIIKGKGLPPICSHRSGGHIIIRIICLTLSSLSPSCPYLSVFFCWWSLSLWVCALFQRHFVPKSVQSVRAVKSICVGYACENSCDPPHLPSIDTRKIHKPTATTYPCLFTQRSTIWIWPRCGWNVVLVYHV